MTEQPRGQLAAGTGVSGTVQRTVTARQMQQRLGLMGTVASLQGQQQPFLAGRLRGQRVAGLQGSLGHLGRLCHLGQGSHWGGVEKVHGGGAGAVGERGHAAVELPSGWPMLPPENNGISRGAIRSASHCMNTCTRRGSWRRWG